MPPQLELGNILNEVKKHETDAQAIAFLEEYLEMERDLGYSFKDAIRDLLTRHVSEGGQ
jgi:hypothetical protein